MPTIVIVVRWVEYRPVPCERSFPSASEVLAEYRRCQREYFEKRRTSILEVDRTIGEKLRALRDWLNENHPDWRNAEEPE